MNRKIFLVSLLVSFFIRSYGAPDIEFHKFFADSTIRIDYIFSGMTGDARISLSGIEMQPCWAGRRINLNHVPFQGNGQIIVKDNNSGDTIYVNSFSSLFQEWLSTPEAEKTNEAMENTFLVPAPRDTASIELVLFDNYRRQMAAHKFLYSPDDILVRKVDGQNDCPYKYIHKSGSPVEKIDVAILAEGYTMEEMDSFYLHAEKAVKSILSHEPFKGNADKFNFLAVASPSKDSGVSVPKYGRWKDTAFSSHYSTFYSDRYLTTSDVKSIHDALRGIPYEHIIILANEEEYGGGGIFNFYTLTTSKNEMFWPVVTHEFGHSFGGLADEYFYEDDLMDNTYPDGVEPWEGNLTTLTDFDSKWKDMLNPDQAIPTQADENVEVGVFEGGGYRFTGVYRPVDKSCRMRFNQAQAFCPVCQRTIQTLIDFYTVEEK